MDTGSASESSSSEYENGDREEIETDSDLKDNHGYYEVKRNFTMNIYGNTALYLGRYFTFLPQALKKYPTAEGKVYRIVAVVRQTTAITKTLFKFYESTKYRNLPEVS